MSGGHWDYESQRIENSTTRISEDAIVKERWPELGKLISAIGSELARCEHDMDWDICGDQSIEADSTWERERIGAILEVAMMAAPDEWFPRGKWGTIQAVQDRQAHENNPPH